MTIVTRRPLDDAQVSSSMVRVIDIPTGSKIISVVDVRSTSGAPSLNVDIFRIDPGAKAKLGGAIITGGNHAGINAAGTNELDADEVAASRFTGLWRIEYTFSGSGNLILTHSVTCKD